MTEKNDNSFLGWLLLGILGFGLLTTAKPSITEIMKKTITSHATLPEIRKIANELTQDCNMNEICRIERIYRYVADQYNYMPDPWNEDLFSNALETIYVGAGDCDCKSILLATLLRANGFPVALVFTPGHVLVEAYVSPDYLNEIPTDAYRRPDLEIGGEWILLESTVEGAPIGYVDFEFFQTQLSRGDEQRIEI